MCTNAFIVATIKLTLSFAIGIKVEIEILGRYKMFFLFEGNSLK